MPPLNQTLVEEVRKLIHAYPSFGYRRIWAMLRFRQGRQINQKAVYRVLQLKGWFVHQRRKNPRPRVASWKSQSTQSDQRWSIDVTHVDCGRDGWGHLTAILDCHDREVVGYEFALRGRAREAQRTLEEACMRHFGSLRPEDAPVIRSDNGLIFQSKRFRDACRLYGLRQEFITPYTPQQNGLVERFFRSLKEECVWIQTFRSFDEAAAAIESWIRFYNEERPHQALRYMSPVEFRAGRRSHVA